MNDKPIIRHCRNCKWSKVRSINSYCTVKYDVIILERIKALFCRYYKQKEHQDE